MPRQLSNFTDATCRCAPTLAGSGAVGFQIPRKDGRPKLMGTVRFSSSSRRGALTRDRVTTTMREASLDQSSGGLSFRGFRTVSAPCADRSRSENP
jgi:hypothetical protein